MIKLQCKCGHTLELPDKLAGQKIRCKRCQKVMRVPRPRTGSGRRHSESDPSLLVAGSRPCPNCGKDYPPSTVVCVTCGVNIDSGAMLYASIEERAPGEMRAPREADLEAAEDDEPPAGFFKRLLKKLGLG